MKWFTYDQNNSGGFFIDNDQVSHLICIQANTAEEANAKAQNIVTYYSDFCECCGERWYICEREGDGADVPSQYGKPLADQDPVIYRETAVLHFANGEVRKVKIGSHIDL